MLHAPYLLVCGILCGTTTTLLGNVPAWYQHHEKVLGHVSINCKDMVFILAII